MGIAYFCARAVVKIDGQSYELLRQVDGDIWQLEDCRTRRIVEKGAAELRTLYAEHKLHFLVNDPYPVKEADELGKPHRDLSEKEIDDAKIRRAFALAAAGVPASQASLEEVARTVWAQLGRPAKRPCWTTVYRWRRKLIASGRDITALVSNNPAKGNRSSRVEPAVARIVENNIQRIYLTREKKTYQDVIDQSQLDVARENARRPQELQLNKPAFRIVKRMISALPAYDVCVAREGREIAARKFRSVSKHRVTQAPLEHGEIDHTLIDMMVVDDKTWLPLGRPVLTVCIDHYTRCVLGINIGFEPPSFLSVARCLKAAILPKDNLRQQYPDIDNDWPMHGVMRELSMDNGLEFHSASLEQACLSLGIEMHYSPRKTPWFKPVIERFLGTFNRGVAHGAPGTTFSNIFERQDYDPVKHAVIRLSTLQQMVRGWIVDKYHQRPHRTLRIPPAVMWRHSIRPEDIPLAADPERLDAILGRREQRVLTHAGVQVHNLLYNSPELTELRRLHGEKLTVEVSINDGDIGSIAVLSPDKTRVFTVPAVDDTYAKGTTVWQHRLHKRYAERFLDSNDITACLEAKERIAKLIQQELTSSKARKRTNTHIARHFDLGGDSSADGAPPVATAPAQQESVCGESSKPAGVRSPTPTIPPEAAPEPDLIPSSQSVTVIPRFKPIIRGRGNED